MADILRARMRQGTDDGPKEVRVARDGDARQRDSPLTLPAVVAKGAVYDRRRDGTGSGQRETSSGSPAPKTLPRGVVLGKDGKP